MNFKQKINIISLLGILVLFAGCAVKQPSFQDPRDDFEGYNRGVFSFNETLDKAMLKPMANLYQSFVPSIAQRGVYNVFANLDDVPNAVNHLLQGNIIGSANDIMRVVINSTLGIAGLFDVASNIGFSKSEEDFGQTLAVWGVGPGSYFVVPLLGPSTLRDFSAQIIDLLLNPLTYIGDSNARLALYGLKGVHQRSDYLAQEEIIRTWSPDFYVAIRNYYLSRRAFLTDDALANETDDLYKELN